MGSSNGKLIGQLDKNVSGLQNFVSARKASPWEVMIIEYKEAGSQKIIKIQTQYQV